MRVALPPSMGRRYRSPRRSKTIVRPSGVTSNDIHVASSVVKLMVRVVLSGRPEVASADVSAQAAAPNKASVHAQLTLIEADEIGIGKFSVYQCLVSCRETMRP